MRSEFVVVARIDALVSEIGTEWPGALVTDGDWVSEGLPRRRRALYVRLERCTESSV